MSVKGAREKRRASIASVLATSQPGGAKADGSTAFSLLIDAFLSEVKDIGDRTPSDDEIAVSLGGAVARRAVGRAAARGAGSSRVPGLAGVKDS